MKFTLIIGTLNRQSAIESCLDSIFCQTYKDYEIIIIDQSDGYETELYIKNLGKNIVYRHVRFKRLSRARNEALKLATGDYFCLLDDDAYYDKDYLYIISNALKDDKAIISGYIWDTVKKADFAKYPKTSGIELSINQILSICPSAGLTIPTSAYKEHDGFDERFGVGSRFGAAEETDYLFKLYRNGYKVYYIKDARLNHPVPLNCSQDTFTISKRFSYWKGVGAFYKKNLVYNSEYILIIPFMLKVIKCLLKMVMPFRLYPEYTKVDIKGVLDGFKEYKDENVL